MIQVPPPGVNTGALAPSDAPPQTPPVAEPHDAADAAPALPSRDPLLALASANGLHADVKQLAGQLPAGTAPAHDPWLMAGLPGALHQFVGGVVLAGAPLGAKMAAPPGPQKIGGPSAPTLEPGKASGPIVTDLQGHLNLWHERQWRYQQGGPG